MTTGLAQSAVQELSQEHVPVPGQIGIAGGVDGGEVIGVTPIPKGRQEKRIWLAGYKAALGCADCGTRVNLQFDHREKETKRFKIGANVAYGWTTLLEEVAKCDVRCAPCHARRHHKEEPGLRAGKGLRKTRRKSA